MAVTVTVGTNSYIAVADADTYFGDRLYTTDWDDATPDQQGQALIMASKAIDRLQLAGIKTDSSQDLQFPRDLQDGNDAQTAVPQPVLDACCEEALALLQFDPSDRQERLRQGLKSVSAGDVTEAYWAAGARQVMLSAEAYELLQAYLDPLGSVTRV